MARVDIDVYANDKTGTGLSGVSGKLDALEAGFQSLTGFSFTAAGAMVAVGSAVSDIVDYTKEAVDEVTKYNDQIVELARVTGNSLEDTSRLIQVAKDMGIEYKELLQGLGNATKNGVDVSIDSLLSLADEYKELETPIDRAKWLTENFGAAGQDLAPIFEAARQDIVEDMDAVGEALVWDDEKQASVEAYKAGMADVKSAFEELKMEVGMNVLPTIQALLNVMNDEEGWRSEGFKRMVGDVKTESWAAVDAVKALLNWLSLLTTGPYGGKWFDADALGFGGAGYQAPNPYAKPNTPPNTGLPPGWGTIPDNGNDGPGGANGLDFIVPPGYSNDSFPIRAESGEHVQITPANRTQQGGGIDYDRMTRSFVEALERSSLVR
jgi:hypothetical protein